MQNLFDGIQSTAFDIVTNTMGYDAVWMPSDNSPSQTARILFKNPTESTRLQNVEYDPLLNTMEYKQGDFNGLKESVDQKNNEELEINGIRFRVLQITAKYDGKTLIADLEQLI